MRDYLSCHELVSEAFESVESSSSSSDSGPIEIKNVKILGYKSKKGRSYTPECCEYAVQDRIYEGMAIGEDHEYPDPQDPPGMVRARAPRDLLGFLRNVRHVKGEGLFADAVFTVNDKLTQSVREAAKFNPKQYGFSPHHDYQHAPNDPSVVQRITKVYTVDLVTNPATTGGLFEGEAIVSKEKTPAATDKTPEKKTIKQALEGVCQFKFQRKIVTALEAEAYMSSPLDVAEMPQTDNPEEKFKAIFRQAVDHIIDDESYDDAQKLAMIKKVFKAQSDLIEGPEKEKAKEGEESGEKPEGEKDKEKAKGAEGDASKPDEDSTGEKSKEALRSQARSGIGALEAMKLLESKKVTVTSTAMEALQNLDKSAAEKLVEEFAARDSQIAKLKELTSDKTPSSIKRFTLDDLKLTGKEGQQTNDGKTAEGGVEKAKQAVSRFTVN